MERLGNKAGPSLALWMTALKAGPSLALWMTGLREAGISRCMIVHW
jgi:hypothetical protein